MRCLLLWLITGSCFGIIFRLTKFTRVLAQFHTCAIDSARGLLCWGLNDDGQVFFHVWACGFVQFDVGGPSSLSGLLQLGDGTTISKLSPTAISGLSLGVLVVSLGSYHSCAIDAARVLYCWGKNTNGQVGMFVCRLLCAFCFAFVRPQCSDLNLSVIADRSEPFI